VSTPQELIRNFCIIAHIDHGKSTLADRLLEITGTIEKREMRAQVLDGMDLERERGITIKAHPVVMRYRPDPKGPEYLFHLIDTPGHVDFRYEVSRALAACEGAILVVDASQGVEAQTLANIDLALEVNLTLIPVLNKIDLPGSDIPRCIQQLSSLGFAEDEVIAVSAKEGTNVSAILKAVIDRVPPPSGNPDAPFRALICDSQYDAYLGAVAYVRVVDGSVRPGQIVRMASNRIPSEVIETGVFCPARRTVESLEAGCVGYVTASIKKLDEIRVGDTLTADEDGIEPLSGYREPLSMVFAGLYPIDGDRYDDLRKALEKLQLNDAAFEYEPETSAALGFGFRCGFLGLLHMEIIQERLEREFNLDLLTTAPSVEYKVTLMTGETILVENPALLPPAGDILEICEPYIRAKLYTPEEYVGAIMQLSQDKRGTFIDMKYLSKERAVLEYDLPLAEVVLDYFDKLKSLSKGYASLDYEYAGHKPGDLVRMDIRVNEEPVDALSSIVHRERSYYAGRRLCEKLKELIPRQQFQIPVQAAIGARVIARETIRAVSKNVIAKCYGGDITRKRKLIEKQKEGKKRMKTVGRVEIPQRAFMAVLEME
jgi:GTP-binding protein LepA